MLTWSQTLNTLTWLTWLKPDTVACRLLSAFLMSPSAVKMSASMPSSV